jgi:hypothetical protein
MGDYDVGISQAGGEFGDYLGPAVYHLLKEGRKQKLRPGPMITESLEVFL